MENTKLKQLFSRIGADSVLIINGSSPFLDPLFWYFSDMFSGAFESCALMLRPKSMAMITSTIEYQTALSQARFPVRLAKENFWSTLRKELDGGTIGLNYSAISHSLFLEIKRKLPHAKFVDISKAASEIRRVKHNYEVARIKKSADIASRSMDKVRVLENPGTELELKSLIDSFLTKYGSAKSPFNTIVAAGRNSAFPHHAPSSYKIKRGNFVLCDFGATCKNYVSDITRTWVLGTPTQKQKFLYDTVREAQQLAIDSISPGIRASEPYELVVKFFAKHGLKKNFTHSLGHMIGIMVHDGERLSGNSNFVLEPGMVFTVEPGLYLKGFGGVRIEDDVVVTKKGCKLLTTAKKEF